MQKIFAVLAFTEEGGRKKERAFLCDQGKSASEHNWVGIRYEMLLENYLMKFNCSSFVLMEIFSAN